jgi:hypothetical protein
MRGRATGAPQHRSPLDAPVAIRLPQPLRLSNRLRFLPQRSSQDGNAVRAGMPFGRVARITSSNSVLSAGF